MDMQQVWQGDSQTLEEPLHVPVLPHGTVRPHFCQVTCRAEMGARHIGKCLGAWFPH